MNCPFCHGFEVRDQRIVQIVDQPVGLHPTALWRQLSDSLTVVLHDPGLVVDERLTALRAAGVDVRTGPATRLLSDDQARLIGVQLADGTRLDADAVVVGSRFRARVEAFAGTGLTTEPHPSGAGDVVTIDGTGHTSVRGLYAAGTVTDPAQQLLQAAAQGSFVGAMISFSLADEDLGAAQRLSASQRDWNQRYGGEQLWSGHPNGTLVAEATDLPVGKALDVGAGEGGDAVWLAERGWAVTASDVSESALDRVLAAAEQRQVRLTCLQADANARNPYSDGAFDLVSIQYAAIPRTPDGRAVANLLHAVAPGGTLLMVGHDVEPMRTAVSDREHAPIFDPDAYLSVADVAGAIAAAPGWSIEINAKRPRPPGAVSTHHVDDVVLRAQRNR